MARRLLLCLAVLLIVAAPASGDDIHHRKAVVDARIAALQTKITNAKAREGVLTQQISAVSKRIDALQGNVTQAQDELNTLEGQLAASQRRLERVTELFKLQTSKLEFLRKNYAVALARLQRRVLQAYETPDPDAVDVLLSATSMSSMLSDIEYLAQIGRQDQRVSSQLDQAKNAMYAARERTRTLKGQIAAATAAIRVRTDRQHAVTAALISSQQQLTAARSSRQDSLSSIKVNEQQFVGEATQLQAASSALEARIQAAERAAAARAAAAPKPSSGGGSTGTPHPSSSGLIWPVNGPIASPFGPRCLPNGDCSFHPGIDIAVPSGTPIHAAAAGTVIYAGWMSGYGNLSVIDHGNGLATAYGHQSSIGVSVGQTVSQGQVIGLSGCTGYCFGPHVHFEVRVNGVPVNPLGYL
jgi:murein DD-endopeptidase MepM/ murein hydrolase activator NlpD